MLDKSLAYRLSIYISLAVIVVFVTFIVTFFLFNLKIIRENIDNTSQGISAEVSSNVRRYVVTCQEVSQNIAEQILFYDQNNYVEPFISNLLAKYTFINAIHIDIDPDIPLKYHNFFGFRENDSTYFFNGNHPLENCVSEHAHYREMLENPDILWSEPILCKRSNKIVVSYYVPIRIKIDNEEKDVGSVVCELSLYQLSETINSIQIGEKGFSILLSKNGTYISHPVKEWILNRNISDLSSKVYDSNPKDIKLLLAGDTAGTVIAYPELLNYEKCYVYYSPIKETGWVLLLVIPYQEMFEPLYLPMLKMLFFSVLGILVIYILITYIANKQIQPLSSLTMQLRKFTNISSESYGGEESSNEIKQVSESLNLMKLWYEQNKLKASNDEKLNKLQQADLLQAAEIQQSLIKVNFPAFPEIPEIDLYAYYRPARVVSGDLFDYFFRDEDELILSMGDVSGKGIPAALFMTVAQTVVKTVASDSKYKKSGQMMSAISNELHSNNLHQFFVTLFLGRLNIRTGRLTYCNAAHNTTYILKADGRVDALTDSHGLPLGLYRDKNYREGRYQLENGDSLILYTDGVTELHDANKLLYGHERLKENLGGLQGLEPREMVERIEKSMRLFAGNVDPIDDISILVLKYYG